MQFACCSCPSRFPGHVVNGADALRLAVRWLPLMNLHSRSRPTLTAPFSTKMLAGMRSRCTMP